MTAKITSRRLRMGLLAAAAPAMLSLFATPALAQDAPVRAGEADNVTTVPEVVVTARRVEENAQDVPLTVTAVTGEQMKQQAIVNARDLTYTVPSLTIAPSFNTLYNLYSIRGLAAGVSTYFSESPCCSGGASMPFMDIGSVQVLNGPQGTLFGRSSGSGAILITPQHPNMDEFEGSVSVTVGDYGRKQATAVVNVPIIAGRLAARFAVNANDIEGFTSEIGTSFKFDEQNNQQYRAALEYKGERFNNYTVASYMYLDQAHSSEVLAAINPNIGLFNLTPATAQTTFAAVCNTAVNAGLSPNVSACVAQRYALTQAMRPALEAEMARVRNGGGAIRFQPRTTGGQPAELKQRAYSIVNVAEYDFGQLGPVDLQVKNITSLDWCTNVTASPADGVGGIVEQSGAFNTCGTGESNTAGPVAVVRIGKPIRTLNNDLQVHFNAGEGLLEGTIGYFYSRYKLPSTSVGTGNIYQLFGGVLNANLGHNSALGFNEDGNGGQKAAYGQATLDLEKLVNIHGLKLTGGYRYSWDETFLSSRAAVMDLAKGAYVPGALSSLSTSSKGYNYMVSVSEEFTEDFMAYFTVSRAYIPGGLNTNIQNATGLPNYKPTFDPQTVIVKELGAKLDFNLAGMPGRLNGAIYDYDFTDIAVGFSGFSGTVSVAYTANVAAAKLRGLELSGTLLPTPQWELRAGYNYNDAEYTDWTATDPLNAARPGDAICLPSSPAGFCLLDLTDNPFIRMPQHQGNLTVVYHAPLDDSLGRLDLSATAYAQSRVYYVTSATRHLQTLPGSLDGISQKPYWTLNLRANWANVAGSDWSLGAFINNATDKVYKLSNTSQLLTLGFSIATYAPPRMFGLEISRKF